MKTFENVEELKTFINKHNLRYDIQTFDPEYDSWSSCLAVYEVSLEKAFSDSFYKIVITFNN